MQVYMEGAAPALTVQFRNEISMDSWLVLVTVNESLNGIQHQWLNYDQGLKMFHNHGINAR